RWPPEASRRARLALRDPDRGNLRLIHPVEIDEVAIRVDDRDRELPIARRLLGLGHRGGDDLRGTIDGNRRAVWNIERHLVRDRRRRRGRRGRRGRWRWRLRQYGAGHCERRTGGEQGYNNTTHA